MNFVFSELKINPQVHFFGMRGLAPKEAAQFLRNIVNATRFIQQAADLGDVLGEEFERRLCGLFRLLGVEIGFFLELLLEFVQVHVKLLAGAAAFIIRVQPV